MLRTLLGIVYIIIGAVVASNHHYFTHLGDWKGLLSAVLAVILWPLVLFGVNLHIGHLAKK